MSKLGELKEILKKLIAIPSVTGNEHDICHLYSGLSKTVRGRFC